MNKKTNAIMINRELANNKFNTYIKKNELTLHFPQSQEFKNKEVALAYLGLYYSWRNVTQNNNNNKFGYIWVNNVFYPIDLPDGFYSIFDLNNFMQQITMTNNNHFVLDVSNEKVFFIDIKVNPTYYSATTTCRPISVPNGGSNPHSLQLGNVPQLQILDNNFGSLIGYDVGLYPPTAGTTVDYYVNSQNIANITPVTSVNVNCNLAESQNSIFSNSIYQFSPTVPYASYISFQTTYPMFYDISNGSYKDITVYFTDQSGKPLDILDGNINVTLLVRDR